MTPGVVVMALIDGVTASFWTIIFLLTVLYIFALIARSSIGLASEYQGVVMPDQGPIDDYFGSVWKCVMTMFQILSQDGWYAYFPARLATLIDDCVRKSRPP